MRRFVRYFVIGLALLWAAWPAPAAEEADAPPTVATPILLPGEMPPACREHALARHKQFALADQVAEKSPNVVFIGDSLVEGWRPLPRLANGRTADNRGVACDTINGVHERLVRDVIARKPRVAVILVGINDMFLVHRLASWNRADYVALNVTAVALRLQSHGIQPLVVSLLPVRNPLPGMSVAASNELLRDLNTNLRRHCAKLGVEFLDVQRALGDGSRGLQENYTTDGLHLSPEAYRLLNTIVEKQLRRMLD